jgi:hypothetical protein
MLLSYERSLQPGLVGAGLIVPVAGLIEAEILILRHQLNIQRCHLPKRLTFRAMDRLIFVGLSFGANYPQGAEACGAGDCLLLASCRVQVVLAPEVTTSFRPPDGSGRTTTADPRDQHRQSAVGSATDPWRVAQARHRDQPDQRRQGMSPSIWPGEGARRPKAGRHSSTIMPTASRRWCRRSHFVCCMAC